MCTITQLSSIFSQMHTLASGQDNIRINLVVLPPTPTGSMPFRSHSFLETIALNHSCQESTFAMTTSQSLYHSAFGLAWKWVTDLCMIYPRKVLTVFQMHTCRKERTIDFRFMGPRIGYHKVQDPSHIISITTNQRMHGQTLKVKPAESTKFYRVE
jgi:hypothetical protein